MNPVSGHKQTAQCEHAGDADAAAQDPSRRCFLQWSALAVAAGLLRVPLAAAGSSAGHVQTLPSQRYYDGDPAAGQNPLRFASSGNVVHNGKESIGKRGVQIRWPYVLGSSDLSELRLLLDNWCFSYRNNAMVNPGNTLPIQGASLEIAGLVKPITFGGAAGITLDDGANDVLSDPLTPADFALATFARGTTVYVKMLVMFDLSTVSNLCNSSARSTSQSGARVAWFDPTVTTSSDVYAAGQWTQTGDAVQSRPNGYVPKLVGRHVDAAAKAWLCVGDSLCQGTGDAGSATRVAGLGWMSRAMRDSSDADASQIGYMNMAVNGSTSTLALADARSATLARYATHAVVMYGTNDIASPAPACRWTRCRRACRPSTRCCAPTRCRNPGRTPVAADHVYRRLGHRSEPELFRWPWRLGQYRSRCATQRVAGAECGSSGRCVPALAIHPRHRRSEIFGDRHPALCDHRRHASHHCGLRPHGGRRACADGRAVAPDREVQCRASCVGPMPTHACRRCAGGLAATSRRRDSRSRRGRSSRRGLRSGRR
jgi:hypothetical protein